ncbi:MAG TPA: uracil-DNA glycosylase [Deltaproteobacteria bacterium]|nr:uracil-DNA glycosylase [Deltaproteobacteria bacterium]
MNKKNRDFDTFWRMLQANLTAVLSTNTIFNQYRDCNDQVDIPDAATIRTENLRRYMFEVTETASILVVGEAAGPWGCRFSGVPFTGEIQLLDPSFPLDGNRSSRKIPACPTKISPPFTSRSAEIFWSVMLPYYSRFLAWDAFPLHSHEPHHFLTVRNPTKNEISRFGEALRLVKEYMNPTHIVAVGKKAFEELDALGEASIYVRHPSRGGKAEFTAGMQSLLKNEGIKR